MKKVIYILALAFAVSACNNSDSNVTGGGDSNNVPNRGTDTGRLDEYGHDTTGSSSSYGRDTSINRDSSNLNNINNRKPLP
jgi:hypothetical protein